VRDATTHHRSLLLWWRRGCKDELHNGWRRYQKGPSPSILGGYRSLVLAIIRSAYSSRELDRLVRTLKDEPSEAVTLVILGGGSIDEKTITAEAIAKQLATNLVRVGLSRVVSKYIGETE
jgi:hypothetical protein